MQPFHAIISNGKIKLDSIYKSPQHISHTWWTITTLDAPICCPADPHSHSRKIFLTTRCISSNSNNFSIITPCQIPISKPIKQRFHHSSPFQSSRPDVESTKYIWYRLCALNIICVCFDVLTIRLLIDISRFAYLEFGCYFICVLLRLIISFDCNRFKYY